MTIDVGSGAINRATYCGFGDPTIGYKTGNSKASCEADSWNVVAKYAGFTSQEWVKVRVNR